MNKSSYIAFFKETALVLLSAVICLAIVGVVLRSFDDFGLYYPPKFPTYTANGELIYYGRPWREVEFQRVIELNESGYYATSFEAAGDDKIRIGVIGDSFVEAFQLSREDNFVAKAGELLPETQLMPLGKSAQYSPLQLRFFRDQAPQLFGASGVYPPTEGYIFCFRDYGLKYIANGVRDYGISKPTLPWQYRLKAPIVSRLRNYCRRVLRSPSHAASFVANRVDLLLSCDLDKELPEIDEETVQRTKNIFVNEVLQPIAALAKERDMRVGFLYIPNYAEATADSGSTASQWRITTLESFRETNVTYLDATKYFDKRKDAFFDSDKHPNLLGHSFLSLALRDIILEVFPEATHE